MDREYIIEILDNIDRLMLNELDKNLKFTNPLKCQEVANEISKLPRLEEIEENSVLYKRIRAVRDAFFRASNKGRYEVKDYSKYYFRWLEGEKEIAEGKELSLRESVNLSVDASMTGHEDNEKVKQILDSSYMFSGKKASNLPKKITWIDKLRNKLNRIFRRNIAVETNKPKVDSKAITEAERKRFASSIEVTTQQPVIIYQQIQHKPDVVVISDLHGNMQKWEYVKNAMQRNPKLQLIIEGDAMDRGPFGLQILMQIKELCDQGRAEYLPGNHDSFAYNYLKTEGTQYAEYEAAQFAKENWEKNGGEVTKQSFENFDNIMNNEIQIGNIKNRISKEELIDWLGSRPIQKALRVNNQDFALGHAIFDEELYKADPDFNLYKALVKELRGEKDLVYHRYLNCMWYREEDESTHYAPLALPKDYVTVVGHTKQLEADLKKLGNEQDKPVIYIDCGLGKLQGFSLTTMKSVQLEPKNKDLTK